MLIYIEGCDLTGKTTLARAVAHATGAELMHFGPPKTDAFEEYVMPIRQYRPGTGRHVVLDRGHLGELVWPYIFGREPVSSGDQLRQVDQWYAARGALLVCATAEPGEVLARLEERGDDAFDAGMAADALDAFEAAFLTSGLAKVEYRIGGQVRLEHVLAAASREEQMLCTSPTG